MMNNSHRFRTVGRHALYLIAPVLVAGACWLPGAVAQLPGQYQLADLKAIEQVFTTLADQVRPSVVAIRTYSTIEPEAETQHFVKMPYSQGSGFVIDGSGYVGTNFHVVDGADAIDVIVHTGETLEATLVQADRRRDLAVLKVDSEGLVPVRFGDLKNVRVNQWTFACGNPFGLANRDGNTSVSFGMVSALGRQMTAALVGTSQVEYYGNLIETTSTINPGNSGGPLFNADGEVIGVVTAIETSSGVSEGGGFAIPVDENTRHILNTLKSGKPVRYGYMGVTIEDVRTTGLRRVSQESRSRGARVTAVTTGGPADEAGLSPDDVVVDVGGTPVEDSDHLVRLIQYRPVGSEVDVTYLRDRVKHKAKVTLADRNEMLGVPSK